MRRVDTGVLLYLAVDYFYAHFSDFRRAFDECQNLEQQDAQKKFGSPIKDNEGWNQFHTDLQKKRAPITKISGDIKGLIESKEIGVLYEDAIMKSIAEYSDCLKSKLGDLQRFVESTKRLKKIQAAVDFDSELFHDEMETIRKHREKKN